MRIEQYSTNQFIKTPNEIEKLILNTINRYFTMISEEETNIPKNMIEVIINEVISRVSRNINTDGGSGVTSVNNKTGKVELNYVDIGAEPRIIKNSAFNKNFGNLRDSVCEGNDIRLYDKRDPNEHKHKIEDIDGINEELNNFKNQIETTTEDILKNNLEKYLGNDLNIFSNLIKLINDLSNDFTALYELTKIYKNLCTKEYVDSKIQQMGEVAKKDHNHDDLYYKSDYIDKENSKIIDYTNKESSKIIDYTDKENAKMIDYIDTHIKNNDIHITKDEKETWNNKQDKITFNTIQTIFPTGLMTREIVVTKDKDYDNHIDVNLNDIVLATLSIAIIKDGKSTSEMLITSDYSNDEIKVTFGHCPYSHKGLHVAIKNLTATDLTLKLNCTGFKLFDVSYPYGGKVNEFKYIK